MKRISYESAFGHCVLGPMADSAFQANYNIALAEAISPEAVTVETLPDPDPAPPTETEQLRADVDYIAAMMGVEL